MIQDSGRFHLETVELCFGREALLFPGGFCSVPVGFSGGSCFAAVEFSAPVIACSAGAAAAGSNSL